MHSTSRWPNTRFGFDEIQDLRCGRMQVDALNSDAYRGFAVFYEEALEAGSALLYYPQTLA